MPTFSGGRISFLDLTKDGHWIGSVHPDPCRPNRRAGAETTFDINLDWLHSKDRRDSGALYPVGMPTGKSMQAKDGAGERGREPERRGEKAAKKNDEDTARDDMIQDDLEKIASTTRFDDLTT